MAVDVDRPDDDVELPVWRRFLSSLLTLGIFALVIVLWPAPLGGSTRLVIVSGHSMEPTYDFGDMVVTRDGDDARIGETVVFAVPEGESGAGILVIHRVIGFDDDGFFVTQGDNQDTADRWPIAQSDIVGEPLLHIPKGGHVVFFLQQWAVIAVLVGLLTVFVFWPSKRVDDPDPDRDQAEIDIVFAQLVGWSTIDQRAIDEAEAWLDEQLEAIVRTPVPS